MASPRIFLFLLLLSALLTGCGKQYVASDPGIPPQSPSLQTQAPRSKSRAPAKVVERSVGFLGAPRNLIHEVGPLETIWRIARMYDVTPDSIYRANGIRPNDQLKVGQKLSIPNARMIRHVINLYPSTKWKYIVVHHTATGKGNAKTIHRSHGERGFWNGLGYHFLIDNGTLGKGDGQIEMSPRWIRQQVGAHCKASGMNDMAIGISLVGNFNTETPTPNQLQSLSLLLTTLRNYYRIPSNKTFGHREVPGAKTECPGSLFPISALRSLN